MHEGWDATDVSSRVDTSGRQQAEGELRPHTEGGECAGVHHGDVSPALHYDIVTVTTHYIKAEGRGVSGQHCHWGGAAGDGL